MSDIPVSEQQIREVRDGKRWEHGAANDAVIAAICDLALERLRTAQPKGEGVVTLNEHEREKAIAALTRVIKEGNDTNLWPEEFVPLRNWLISLRAPSPSAVATSSGEGERDFEREGWRLQVAHLRERVMQAEAERDAALSPPAKASGAFEGVTEDAAYDIKLLGFAAETLVQVAQSRGYTGIALEAFEYDAKRLRSLASRLTRGYAAERQLPPVRERDGENWTYPYAFLEAVEKAMHADDFAPSMEGIELALLAYERVIGHGIYLPAPYVSAESEGAGS